MVKVWIHREGRVFGIIGVVGTHLLEASFGYGEFGLKLFGSYPSTHKVPNDAELRHWVLQDRAVQFCNYIGTSPSAVDHEQGSIVTRPGFRIVRFFVARVTNDHEVARGIIIFERGAGVLMFEATSGFDALLIDQ